MLTNTLMMFMLLATPPKTTKVEIVIPELDVSPYHRPYVAIWVETPDRLGVRTLAVWHEKDEWLKDLRQWWRKLGRISKPTFDGVSGATRKPGTYTIEWDGKDYSGKLLEPGEYIINVEAAREEGGRDFIRQAIVLNGDKEQHFTLSGSGELGKVIIHVN